MPRGSSRQSKPTAAPVKGSPLDRLPDDVYARVMTFCSARWLLPGTSRATGPLLISKARFHVAAAATWATLDVSMAFESDITRLFDTLKVSGFGGIRYGRLVRTILDPREMPCWDTPAVLQSSELCRLLLLCPNISTWNWELDAHLTHWLDISAALQACSGLTRLFLEFFNDEACEEDDYRDEVLPQQPGLSLLLDDKLEHLNINNFSGEAMLPPAHPCPTLRSLAVGYCPLEEIAEICPLLSRDLRALHITASTYEDLSILSDLVSAYAHSLVELSLDCEAASRMPDDTSPDPRTSHTVRAIHNSNCALMCLTLRGDWFETLLFEYLPAMPSLQTLELDRQRVNPLWAMSLLLAEKQRSFTNLQQLAYMSIRVNCVKLEKAGKGFTILHTDVMLFEDDAGIWVTEKVCIKRIRERLAAFGIDFPQSSLGFIPNYKYVKGFGTVYF